MASNTQGIQQLLAAEKKAADKVGEARKRKFNSRIEWIFFLANKRKKWTFAVWKSVYADHVSHIVWMWISHMTFFHSVF